jgi:hypothetical protein
MLERGFVKWIKAADTVVLACWDLGHIWDADLYDNIDRIRHGSYSMTGSCQRRCGVVRTRVMTSSWSLDSSKNSYKYPRGYSPREFMEGNPFFMSAEHRAAIRRELARRAKEDSTHETARRAGKGVAPVVKVKFTG